MTPGPLSAGVQIVQPYPKFIDRSLDVLSYDAAKEPILAHAGKLRVDTAEDAKWQQDMEEALQGTMARKTAITFLTGLAETFPAGDPVGIHLRDFLERV